jgi:sialic acid synthase
LYHYAKGWGLDVIETVCNPGALRVLDYFQPDALKIASRDIRNIPLLNAVGATGLPVIFSTGFTNNASDIQAAYRLLSSRGQPVSVLHCVSVYPAPYARLNMRRLEWLRHVLPDAVIGYSDHTTGVLAPALAVALGAGVIEKHITLDKSLPGTDQAGSMDLGGLWRVVRDVRNAEKALGPWSEHHVDQHTWEKLGRSLAVNRDIPEGEQVSEADLIMVSPGTGLEWRDRNEFVGHCTTQHLAANTILHPGDVA